MVVSRVALPNAAAGGRAAFANFLSSSAFDKAEKPGGSSSVTASSKRLAGAAAMTGDAPKAKTVMEVRMAVARRIIEALSRAWQGLSCRGCDWPPESRIGVEAVEVILADAHAHVPQ